MLKLKLPPVGMRTIKTSIAVFLCLLLFPGEPFFACLTSVFCIQDTFSNSIRMGRVRGWGTVYGALIGLIFLILCKSMYVLIPFSLIRQLLIYCIIAIGIITVIYGCNLMKQNDIINISCIAFLAVTTAHAYGEPLSYAVTRIIETFFGILIGLLVNRYIFVHEKSQD